MTIRPLHKLGAPVPIDVVPGVAGRRAFPTRDIRRVDPFVMLDHIGPQRLDADFVTGGHMHPHRGFETLTLLFEGVMQHVDSSGFEETLRSGSTQNMRAGSGIQHGGEMAVDPQSHVFHEVQLWVNVPAAHKMDPPSVASAHAGDTPIIDRGHYTIEVLAGTLEGHTSPLTTVQPTAVARVRASGPGPVVVGGVPPEWNATVYVLQGSAAVEGQRIEIGHLAVLDAVGGSIELEVSDASADLLVMAGLPIGEPVAMGGPFVMTTQAELDQANADYAAGLFDNVTLAAP